MPLPYNFTLLAVPSQTASQSKPDRADLGPTLAQLSQYRAEVRPIWLAVGDIVVVP